MGVLRLTIAQAIAEGTASKPVTAQDIRDFNKALGSQLSEDLHSSGAETVQANMAKAIYTIWKNKLRGPNTLDAVFTDQSQSAHWIWLLGHEVEAQFQQDYAGVLTALKEALEE